jgi:hypothetical protein
METVRIIKVFPARTCGEASDVLSKECRSLRRAGPPSSVCATQTSTSKAIDDAGSRDSAVGIATGPGLDDHGIRVRVLVGGKIFSSPRCPDQFWGPPSLLSDWYWGLFPRGKAAEA